MYEKVTEMFFFFLTIFIVKISIMNDLQEEIKRSRQLMGISEVLNLFKPSIEKKLRRAREWFYQVFSVCFYGDYKGFRSIIYDNNTRYLWVDERLWSEFKLDFKLNDEQIKDVIMLVATNEVNIPIISIEKRSSDKTKLLSSTTCPYCRGVNGLVYDEKNGVVRCKNCGYSK